MARSESGRLERFCRAYLRTMDPERAAREAGCRDGFAQLAAVRTRERLERMRESAMGQLRREDALRRLAQLAFGQANDGVELALRGRVRNFAIIVFWLATLPDGNFYAVKKAILLL